jgi:ketosteroid isomerase-like protein
MRLTLLIATSFWLAPAQPDPTTIPIPAHRQAFFPAMEKQILRLENERVQAMIQRDYVTLERLMAPECVHIESNGTVRTTPDFMASFKADDFTFDTFVIDENQVRFYGTTAVVTGRYHNVIRTRGQLQPPKRARHTRVWARQADGHWRMVSHQATEISIAKNPSKSGE